MNSTFEKILLWAHYAGFFIIFLVLPLIVSNKFFFPFIFPKAVLFRIIVEVLFLLFLILAVSNSKYRFRLTPIPAIYGLWVIYSFVTSLFGDNFYLSFWGDMERSEGILMHLHFLVFLIILTSVVKTRKVWEMLLGASLLSSFFMGLLAIGQKLDLPQIINTQGDRLSSSIGNPGFFAAVLIINIFIAIYFLLEFRNVPIKLGLSALVIFFTYLVFETGTRGSVLGLLVAALFSLYFIFRGSNKPLKITAGAAVILIGIGAGIIWTNADSQFVKNSNTLNRLANISLKNQTVQTRLMTWEISLKGVRDNPVFGNGLENFNIVFNKYFDANFYQDEGSVVWFDRAHNFFFDRIVAGGVVGVLLYFGIFAYVFWLLLKKVFSAPETRNVSIAFSLMLIAYIIHNLFIFDFVVSYILLMLLLAFINSFESSEPSKIRHQLDKPILYKGAIGIFVIFIIPIIYFGVVQPVRANNLIAQSFHAQAQVQALPPDTLFEEAEKLNFLAYQKLLEGIELNTYGNQEFRIQLTQFVDTLVANNYPNQSFLNAAAFRVNQEIDQQIEADPKNIANYLLFMRHLNFSKNISLDFPRRATEIFEKAVPLSPDRVHLYTEAGYAYVNQGQAQEALNETELAIQSYLQAEKRMKEAIALNPTVVESYINLILVYLSSDRIEQVNEVLVQMDDIGLDYHLIDHLRKLADTAVGYQQYELANQFLQEIQDSDFDSYYGNDPKDQAKKDSIRLRNTIDLALSFAFLGQDEKAIELAEQVRTNFPDRAGDVEPFIEQVKNGYYKTQPDLLR